MNGTDLMRALNEQYPEAISSHRFESWLAPHPGRNWAPLGIDSAVAKISRPVE
jgi:hypothetical protein